MSAQLSLVDKQFADNLYLGRRLDAARPRKFPVLHGESLQNTITHEVRRDLNALYLKDLPPDRLAQVFADVSNKMQVFAKDFETLWGTILDSHVDIRAQSKEQFKSLEPDARAFAMEKIRDRVNPALRVLTSPLCASLVIKGQQAMLESLRAYIGATTTQLSGHMLECLRKGAETGIIGSTHWLNNTTCSLTWCRSVVVITENKVSETLSTRMTQDVAATRGRVVDVRLITRSTVTRKGKFDFRFAQYDQDLMDAESRESIPLFQVVPSRCMRVWKATPRFLRPVRRLAIGKVIRERVVEVDTDSRDWTRREEVDVVERRIVFDPAITIGPYVLTGWTPAEEAKLS